MNLSELLGSSFDCQCGHRHEVPVKKVIYAEDALEHLDEVLSAFVERRRCIIVADKRTWAVAGELAQTQLNRSGWEIQTIIIPDTTFGDSDCDDVTFSRLRQSPPADIALAVGSGVINDLTKWLVFERKIPYVVIATAASMNGYAAANIAATIQGVKTLVAGKAPLAILGIPSIIGGAPYELTAAGLGDALAKSVSTADWMMNHIFHGEYFCRFCSEIIKNLEIYYLNHPEEIKSRQPNALDALYKALIYSG
ncbi:MAG: sn-glycerol-1-phosphate dehydrogenase, partial [Planctomycetes bacterium]|nr:sn-glycerol-1-phosphate dehydrogenase [Planctomycetota bacterium]